MGVREIMKKPFQAAWKNYCHCEPNQVRRGNLFAMKQSGAS